MPKPKVERKRLTVSLPLADWENLEAEALAYGLTIGTYAGRLLRDHVNPVKATGSMPGDEWTALSAWFVAGGVDPRAYGLRTKQAALVWARENGYDR